MRARTAVKRIRKKTGKQTRCFYCGLNLYENLSECTFDHVLPTSKGGPDTDDNKVLACKQCNNDKQAMTLDEFIVWMDEKKKDKSYAGNSVQA